MQATHRARNVVDYVAAVLMLPDPVPTSASIDSISKSITEKNRNAAREVIDFILAEHYANVLADSFIDGHKLETVLELAKSETIHPNKLRGIKLFYNKEKRKATLASYMDQYDIVHRPRYILPGTHMDFDMHVISSDNECLPWRANNKCTIRVVGHDGKGHLFEFYTDKEYALETIVSVSAKFNWTTWVCYRTQISCVHAITLDP